jgi:sigma-B regulation protein RsbU (phosphoserine phosphatase)
MLRAGDRLYLYSDGVPEASDPNGNQFGNERLLTTVMSGRAEPLSVAVNKLREDVERWNATKGAQDDITILALEMSAVASMPVNQG